MAAYPKSLPDFASGGDDPNNRNPGELLGDVQLDYGSGGRKIALNMEDAESVAKGVGESSLAGTYEVGVNESVDHR